MTKSLLHIISFFLPHKLISVIFVLFFINCSLLTVNCFSQWVQQTLPVSGTPYDLKFANANTGWITLTSPNNFLKTTNSGSSWFSLSSGTTQFVGLKFFNDTLGYSFGNLSGNSVISKTTDGGLNWSIIYSTPNAFVNQSFINPDTGWVCGFDGNLGGIWRTTDACVSFQQELSSGSSSMDKIFFLPQRVNGEYIGWCSQSSFFRKTTNSGATWAQVAPITASNKIFFINKDTGWICNGGMFKCTDGGVNWINEPLPNDPSFVFRNMYDFVYAGGNIMYGVGGVRFFSGGGGQDRGVIWKTTNAGLNWGYQQPDTTIHIAVYSVIDFADSLNGWCYAGMLGVHTTNGGGQIIYTGINTISTEIPREFKLYQNYPNPFNPETRIKIQMSRSGYAVLKVFDILGREIKTLIDQKLNSGTYETEFEGNNVSSGVYFYRLTIDGNIIDTKKMLLIK